MNKHYHGICKWSWVWRHSSYLHGTEVREGVKRWLLGSVNSSSTSHVCLKGEKCFSEWSDMAREESEMNQGWNLERTAVEEKWCIQKRKFEREYFQKIKTPSSGCVHTPSKAPCLIGPHDGVCDLGLQVFLGNLLLHSSECYHAFSFQPVAIIFKNGCWAEDMLLKKRIIISVDKLPSRKARQFTFLWQCVRTSIFPLSAILGLLSNFLYFPIWWVKKRNHFYFYLMDLITNEVGHASMCPEVGAFYLWDNTCCRLSHCLLRT